MSVAEFRGPGLVDPPDDSYGEPVDQRHGDRTPPQDHGAEQSVLGAMLLSKDAIADVVETVRGIDFYRPVHETVFDAILDLYGRGEPADALTVSAELTRRGELVRVGGAPYLHTLVAGVPIAANAGYYAEIVREKAILRRLVDAGTKVAQLGYQGEGQVDDVVDRAQAEVYAVTERRTSEDYAPLRDILGPTLDEIEAIGARDGQMVGVPTGFADLDELTNGLHPGQMVVIAARPGAGKALALDTELPTPGGWTTMGEVAVGDQVMGADGRPTVVVAATGVIYDRPCYEVEFCDGTVILADADHQWLTQTRAVRRLSPPRAPMSSILDPLCGGVVTTTRTLSATLRCPTTQARLHHSVRNTAPLELPEAELPVAPYTFGAWLGDGHSDDARFTSADPEIAHFVAAGGYAVRHGTRLTYSSGLPSYAGAERSCQAPVRAELRAPGVLGNKRIPSAYLRASVAQRRALLAGLLDTDGIVSSTGPAQIGLGSSRLADDVYELIVGLGYRCGRSSKRVDGRSGQTSTAFLLTFSTVDEVFRLSRNQSAHRRRRPGPDTTRTDERFVSDVRPVPSVPVRCIQVANDDHLYLAGRSMVPTHNSTMALDICRSASLRHDLTSVIFSLEMNRNEISMKLLSAEARIPMHHIRNGHMSDDDWQRLASTMARVSEKPLFIDDSPNMTMMEIRAKARRLRQRHDLRLVVVDYLQLMTSGKRVESRQVEVSEFSRQMKLLAKELEVPVIAVSQLNRGAEQRTDKRPMLSDLRESGSIEQDSDMVILVHREDMYERESTRPGEADIIVAKHRAGPTANLTVAFQGHYSRFVDMQHT